MDHGEHDPVTIEALLAKVENSRYRALLHDDQLRRRLVFKMLAESDDPILREMGEQLRDGLVTPSQLMSIPEYWEALSRGYEALGGIDLDEVAEQVDAADAAPRDDPSAAPDPSGTSTHTVNRLHPEPGEVEVRTDHDDRRHNLWRFS